MDNVQFGLEVAKVIATLAAASGASYVAWRIGTSQRDIARQQADIAAEQRQIAAAKLNLELFEERYELFMKVWGFLSDALEDTADSVPHPLRPEFTNLIPKARFLFGREIAEYMIEANGNRVRLFTMLRQQQKDGGVPTFEGKSIADYQIWFNDEASNCFKCFAAYLDFSRWKVD
jgi:hypothetical protein